MRWPLMVFLVVLTLILPPLDAISYSSNEETKSDKNKNNIKGSESRKKMEIKNEKLLDSIEKNLMTLFGFSKRPKTNRKDIFIPKAMLELYKKQTGMDVDTTSFMLPGRLTSSANTVRSFTHQESLIDDQFRQRHRFRLSFPIDGSIPKSEKLKAAELQLNRVAIPHAVEGGCNYLQILVHDILLPGIKGKRETITRLIDSKQIFADEDEAVKLDVTPAVERWLADPKGNHGLLVKVTNLRTPSGSANLINCFSDRVPINDFSFKNMTNIKVNSAAGHLRLKREAHIARKDWKKVEPLLFTYTDDGKSKASSATTGRPKRGIRKHKRKDGKEHCRRHELYVKFEDVGWDDWILAPPGYDAFYCSGDCPFPLSDHFNSTNHAIVQTLVNSVFPNTAPKACCVPTALAPISMLYVDEENKVILKNYDDMSILGCGCR